MLTKTKGIVFKSIKYGETSMISSIYTEAFGLQKYVINGVRSKKPKVSAGLLQPLTLLDLVVYGKTGRDLNRIKELRAEEIYVQIPFDIVRGSIGLFLVEVVQKCIRESEAHPELFSFLQSSFLLLDRHPVHISNFHLIFLMQLSAYLGFLPQSNWTETHCYFDLQGGQFVDSPTSLTGCLNKEDSWVFHQIQDKELVDSGHVKLSRESRRQVLENLLLYYKMHVEGLTEIHAHRILETVLD